MDDSSSDYLTILWAQQILTWADSHSIQMLQRKQLSIKTQHFTVGLFLPLVGVRLPVCKCLCLRRVREGQHGKTDARLWRGVNNQSADGRERKQKGKRRERDFTGIVSAPLQRVKVWLSPFMLSPGRENLLHRIQYIWEVTQWLTKVIGNIFWIEVD